MHTQVIHSKPRSLILVQELYPLANIAEASIILLFTLLLQVCLQSSVECSVFHHEWRVSVEIVR